MIRRNRNNWRRAVSAGIDEQAPQQEPSFRFGKEEAQKIFDCLVQSFIEDYMIRKFVAEKSGWRTITEISKVSPVSPSQLYGKQGGGVGSALDEPLKRGVVERRFFPGERGRGGEVARFRIAYDKEPVRNYVAIRGQQRRLNFREICRSPFSKKMRQRDERAIQSCLWQIHQFLHWYSLAS